MAELKQTFTDYIKRKNLKWSRQREFIVDLFLSINRHVTTEELYQTASKNFPEIGYSTVHRTLKLLTECGLASEIHLNDRYTRFEKIRQDQHHDHLVCTECGKIIEFECEKIEKLQDKISLKKGFKITSHRLQLFGICRECRKTSKKGG